MLIKNASVFCIQVCDWACGISLIYSKNNKCSNIDLWGIPQFMVLASENSLPNEMKKALFVR